MIRPLCPSVNAARTLRPVHRYRPEIVPAPILESVRKRHRISMQLRTVKTEERARAETSKPASRAPVWIHFIFEW
jgi:hypothetical protein